MSFIVEDEESSAPKKENSLWCERYRPTKLEDYIGNDDLKEKCKEYLEKQDIPHLLFFGPAGTGKTTLAKLLGKNINCDILYINASAERGIDTIRDKMKNFACSAGFKPLKMLILDEADKLTPDAQGALRNMMETYSAHTRFILTCNYVEKITSPISSRCQEYQVKPISKPEVAAKLVDILTKENVTFTMDDIKFIVNRYYPDIRKVINFAQKSNLRGTIKISKENAVETDYLEKLIDLLNDPNKPGVFNEIRQLTADTVDADSFETIYKHLFEKVDEFAKGKEALIIYEIADALYQSALVIPPVRDITFLSAIYKILKHLK
jgi:DNA polymerase III delta prime subunit